jgi:small multidrug resistance pump
MRTEWVFLGAAIVTELVGTIALRAVSTSLTWWAIALIAVSYSASFAAMAVSLRQLNVGVVYAIWSAVGIAAITLAGWLLFDERLSLQAILGLAVIVAGVTILVTSGTIRHG